MDNWEYDVFISFRSHDDNGEDSLSHFYAIKMREKLSKIGLRVFMSDISLKEEVDTANFPKEIDSAIEKSRYYVLIYDKVENFKSDKHQYVYHEWQIFRSLMLSNKKEKDSMYILGCPEWEKTGMPLPSEFEGMNVAPIETIERQLQSRFGLLKKEPDRSKGSDYIVDSVEEKRLMIQAMMEAKWDVMYFEEKLNSLGKIYNILDVGCADGYNTRLVFGKVKDKNVNINLIGTDKDKGQIEKFNAKVNDDMHGEIVDYSSENWEEQLQSAMKKHNVNKFDYVYCALSLHHFGDSGESFLKKITNYMNDQAVVYIRSNDDGLKLAYPDDENVLQKIIDKYNNLSGISDRYHARKLYRFLRKAKFDHILINHYCVGTEGKSQQELEYIFQSSFAFRKKKFENEFKSVDKNNVVLYNKAKDEWEEIEKLFEKMSDIVTSTNHYYEYMVSVATAVKPSDIINIE